MKVRHESARARELDLTEVVVVGAGFAGLLAARAALDHVSRVTIIERDLLGDEPVARRGTPQGSHLHTLFPRGRILVEEWFPGIRAELEALGVCVVDPCRDFAWLMPTGWGVRFPSQLEMYVCSRDLLELTVRRNLLRDPRVRLLAGTDVLGLVEDRGRVSGVKIRARGVAGSSDQVLRSALVVDASGRGSRAPAWLEELGYAGPPEEIVDASLGYSSRKYQAPASVDREWSVLYVQPAPPTVARGGIMCPIEDGQVLVTLVGTGGDHPPGDEAGFIEFARSLRSPLLHEAISGLAPASPISRNRSTTNRRRFFESMSRHPDGFVAIGDSVCAFNPVYGQGISTAALGAEALGEALRAGIGTVSRRFPARLAAIVAGPWTLATGEDFRVPGATGERPFGLSFIHRYLEHAQALATHDVRVRRALMEVFTLMKPLPALFAPPVAARIALHSIPRPERWRAPASSNEDAAAPGPAPIVEPST